MELPEYIAVAIFKGWGQLGKYNVSQEVIVGETEIEVAPDDDGIYWVLYGYRYGEIDPAGPTADVEIEFNEPLGDNISDEYTDVLTHATMDYSQPFLAMATKSSKLVLKVTNGTINKQTIDMQFLLLKIEGDDHMEEYLDWADEYYTPLTISEGTAEEEMQEEMGEYCEVV